MRTLALVLGAVALSALATAVLYVASMEKDWAVMFASSKQPLVAYPHLVRLYLMPDCEGFTPSPATALEYALNGYGLEGSDGSRVFQVADILLSKGCDNVDGLNSVGLTHLQAAAAFASPDVTKYLLSRGADPLIEATRDKWVGMTALDIARRGLEHYRVRISSGENLERIEHYLRRNQALEEIVSTLEQVQNEI